MATILQTSTGNFSEPSTWAGGVVPSANDHIVSYGGYTLTMDTSITLGSSVQSGGWAPSFSSASNAAPSAAIWMRQGTLIVSDNVDLLLKGDLLIMASVATIGAGVTITIDPTDADVTGTNAANNALATNAEDVGANKFYVVDIATSYGRHNIEGCLTINGTEANPTTIQCVDGGTSFFLAGQTVGGYSRHASGCIDATYTHFKNFGAIPAILATDANYNETLLKDKGFNRNKIIRGFSPRLTHETTNTTHDNDLRFRMVHCVLEDTTGIAGQYGIDNAGSRAQITFEYVTAKRSKYWMNQLHFIDLDQTLDVSDAPTNTSFKVTANVTPFRRMKHCVWDRHMQWMDGAAGWEIEANVFAMGIAVFGWVGHGAITFKRNMILRSNAWGLADANTDFNQPSAWDDGSIASYYGSGPASTALISFQKLPYGTGKRDPDIPAALRTAFGANADGSTASGRMGIGTFIQDNYFLEDHNTSNPHVLAFGGGIGDGAHIIMNNIWEVGDTDGQGESVVTNTSFSEERSTQLGGVTVGTHKTGAVFYAGNINLPSKNITAAGSFWVTTPATNYPSGWQGTNPNTGASNAGEVILGSNYHPESFETSSGSNVWWGSHFPQIYTNNTLFTGISEGAFCTSENGYYRDILRYCKNNIFWDNTTRTNVVWSVGDVSGRVYPDLVIPENLNNNIKINQYGTADTSTAGNNTVEASNPGTGVSFFNANGYRGHELSDPTTEVTYTPLTGGADITVARRNYFGRDDAEFTTSISQLPFANYLNGTPRYSLSISGVGTNADAWQLISKQHDWTDSEQFNGATLAGLREFVRVSQAPVRTSNGFTSVLNDVDVNPGSYYDPEMVTGGNPLGNYGELPYVAADDANVGLIALNAIYQAADAQLGALGFRDTNRLPVAGNDGIIAVIKNTTKSILLSELLVNDSDPDGEALRIISFTQGTKGAVSKTTTHLVYSPTSGSVGADTFTYTVSDPLGSQGTATVTLNIVSDAPVAQNVSILDGESNRFRIIPVSDLLVGATDPDGNDASVTFHSVSTRSSLLPAEAADNVSVTADGSSILYNAPIDAVGEDTFTFNIQDEDTEIGVGTLSIILQAGAGVVSVLTAEEKAQLASVLTIGAFIALQ